jgi:anti-sigma regulatory factor (Ser/Thr protein kinase)
VARIVVALPNDPSGPSLARRSVEEFVAGQELHDEAREPLVLIASELVTNAIVYGADPIVLSVSCHDGDVIVEVEDGDSTLEMVQSRAKDRSAPGGRGLGIVASLADAWGVRPSQSGKTVWAVKAVRQGEG